MLRLFVISAGLFLLGSLAAAQTQSTHTTRKPATAAHPNPSGPTKVTGPGVTTATGLQYWDIKVGTGEKAIRGEKVLVDYTGWLTTGKKFDSRKYIEQQCQPQMFGE